MEETVNSIPTLIEKQVFLHKAFLRLRQTIFSGLNGQVIENGCDFSCDVDFMKQVKPGADLEKIQDDFIIFCIKWASIVLEDIEVKRYVEKYKSEKSNYEKCKKSIEIILSFLESKNPSDKKAVMDFVDPLISYSSFGYGSETWVVRTAYAAINRRDLAKVEEFRMDNVMINMVYALTQKARGKERLIVKNVYKSLATKLLELMRKG